MDRPRFDRFVLTEGDITKPVYQLGQGPGVILMHELPGMVPECVRLGEAIAAAGYSIYLTLFFGSPGPVSVPVSSTIRLCLLREFNLWKTGQKSPITDWLRGLARHVRNQGDTGPIGVIGMCMTGSLALARMADGGIAAPVVSQPALPLCPSLLSCRRAKADRGPSPDQRAAARSSRTRTVPRSSGPASGETFSARRSGSRRGAKTSVLDSGATTLPATPIPCSPPISAAWYRRAKCSSGTLSSHSSTNPSKGTVAPSRRHPHEILNGRHSPLPTPHAGPSAGPGRA
jgi:Dienelactone hydrolase family